MRGRSVFNALRKQAETTPITSSHSPSVQRAHGGAGRDEPLRSMMSTMRHVGVRLCSWPRGAIANSTAPSAVLRSRGVVGTSVTMLSARGGGSAPMPTADERHDLVEGRAAGRPSSASVWQRPPWGWGSRPRPGPGSPRRRSPPRAPPPPQVMVQVVHVVGEVGGVSIGLPSETTMRMRRCSVSSVAASRRRAQAHSTASPSTPSRKRSFFSSAADGASAAPGGRQILEDDMPPLGQPPGCGGLPALPVAAGAHPPATVVKPSTSTPTPASSSARQHVHQRGQRFVVALHRAERSAAG